MQNTIEGIDYIFDRYAFLGLEKNASVKDISTKIRLGKAENHPDKLQRVSQDILNIASRNMELYNQCEQILLNEEIKPLYDEKLNEFIQNSPHLVSTSGVPILDPYRARVDLDYLLNEDVQDLKDLEQKCMQMSGYNPKRLQKSQARFMATPELEEREEYRQELTLKLVYLTIMEGFYWQKAGITVEKSDHVSAQSSEDISKNFQQKIQMVEQQVQTALEQRNGLLALGFTKPLLLGYSHDEALPDDKALVQHVVKQFTLRAEDLHNLMAEKTQTIEELCSVTRHKQLKTQSSNIHDFLLLRTTEGEITENWPDQVFSPLNLMMRLNLDNEKVELLTNPHEEVNSTVLDNYPYNLHVIEPNPEINAPLLELMSFINRTFILNAPSPEKNKP